MSRRDHSLYVIIILLFVVSIVAGFQLTRSPKPSNSTQVGTINPAISVDQKNLNPQLSPHSNYGASNENNNSPDVNNVPNGAPPVDLGSSSSSSSNGGSVSGS